MADQEAFVGWRQSEVPDKLLPAELGEPSQLLKFRVRQDLCRHRRHTPPARGRSATRAAGLGHPRRRPVSVVFCAKTTGTPFRARALPYLLTKAPAAPGTGVRVMTPARAQARPTMRSSWRSWNHGGRAPNAKSRNALVRRPFNWPIEAEKRAVNVVRAALPARRFW